MVVILMLAAMWMYLRTMDESIQPGGEVRPGMPAAPGPPAPAPVGARPTTPNRWDQLKRLAAPKGEQQQVDGKEDHDQHFQHDHAAVVHV
jgi:hypothetical protein